MPSFMPGENDWLQAIIGRRGPFSAGAIPPNEPATPSGIGTMGNRGPSWLPQGGGFGGPLGGDPQAQNTQAQQGGLMGLLGRPETQDFALSLLANSGYSPQKRGLGEIVGASALQARQLGQQRGDDAFKRKYMEAQMAQLGGQPTAVTGPDGKPIYVAERDAIGRSPFLKSGGDDGIGQYNPRDYTPSSWAQFLTDKDPSKLERYESPRQEFKPNFNSVTRTNPDGSTQIGTFDKGTGQYNWDGPIIPAGTKARVDSQGKAEGEASGGQSSKAPVKASMDYVIGEFRKSIEATPQGGLFGYKGKAATVTSKAEKERFDNLREQLSTELRTAFRIPGEGTLSDAEQKQYGIQLPSTDYEPQNNEQILKDLETRTSLRLQTPVGNAPPFQIANPQPGKQPTLDDIRKKYGR